MFEKSQTLKILSITHKFVLKDEKDTYYESNFILKVTYYLMMEEGSSFLISYIQTSVFI